MKYCKFFTTVFRASFGTLGLGLILGCAPQVKSPSYDCNYEQEFAPVNQATKSGAIFLFGERHGTVEAPKFVANFACKIAQDSQLPTLVLLELSIPNVLSDLSQHNMNSADAKDLILEGDSHWMNGHDGRTSAAMMDAITHILELRDQGLNIALGSIYPSENIFLKKDQLASSSVDEEPTNRYFLESLEILSQKYAFHNVIVLSGKNHTQNHLRFFEKMDINVPYLGFVQTSGGGTEWNCQSNGGGCKVHPTRVVRKTLVDSTDDASLVLFNDTDEVFDGAFVFKTTTASLPFFKNQQQQP